MDDADLVSLKKGDDRKKGVAWAVRKKTRVKNEWIVRRLHMGRDSLSNEVAEGFEAAGDGGEVGFVDGNL